MIDYHTLSEAARHHDVVGQGGADDTIIEAGMDPDDAWRYARQRATWLVLRTIDKTPEDEDALVNLTANEVALIEIMKVAIMDGLCVRGNIETMTYEGGSA